MKKRLISLSVLTLAIMFSSTLFTTNANADDNYKRYRNDYNHSYHVKPDYRSRRDDRFEHHRSNRGNKYGHYKKHNKHYKSYKRHDRYDRHDHSHYSKHSYRKDDPQFIFNLVLPLTYLISSFDSHYDGY